MGKTQVPFLAVYAPLFNFPILQSVGLLGSSTTSFDLNFESSNLVSQIPKFFWLEISVYFEISSSQILIFKI